MFIGRLLKQNNTKNPFYNTFGNYAYIPFAHQTM